MTERSRKTVYWFECWLHTAHGAVLHRIVDNVLLKKMKPGKDYFTEGVVESVCGRVAVFHLPGLLSRIGMKRCVRCCKKIGIPEGYGNPHNDKKLEKFKGI
jgi:hypothetical protein